MNYMIATLITYSFGSTVMLYKFGPQAVIDYSWLLMVASALPIAAVKFIRDLHHDRVI